MKKTILICILSFSCVVLFGQERFTIQASTNEDINALVSNSKYVFPEFKGGTVIFSDRTVTRAQMNYNMLTQEMQFVDAQERIMALANPAEIASIQIDGREFVYTSRGYAEVLAYAGTRALLLHRRIKAENEKPSGAYGTVSDVSAVQRQTTFSTGTAIGSPVDEVVTDLSGGIKVNLTVTQAIYLQSGHKLFAGNSEKNFARLFGGNIKTIRNYTTANKLNLKKPTDLILLFNYCADNMM